MVQLVSIIIHQINFSLLNNFNNNIRVADDINTHYRIFEQITVGTDFIENNFNGRDLQIVNVRWSDDPNDNPPTGSSYGHERTAISFERITIGLDRPAFPVSAQHEYGHHVMEAVYNENGSQLPRNQCGVVPPASHTMTSIEHSTCAWSEGWANFFAYMINDSPIMQHYAPNSNTYNFETRQTLANPNSATGTTFPADPNTSITNNRDIEGNVASALWDIHDTNTNSVDDQGEASAVDATRYDDLDGMTNNIWTIFNTNGGQTSFNEFVHDWNANTDTANN